MGWLIALGILAGLAVLPLGISALYDSDGAVIRVVAGPLKIKVFPLKKKGKRKPKAQKKQDVPEKQPAKTKQTPKKSGGSVKDFFPIVSRVLEFLADFRRKLRVDCLVLNLVLAGDDPCDLATNYGKACEALGGLWPMLEENFVIKKRDVKIQCDFEASQTLITARLDVTITIGRLIALGGWHGIRILKELLAIKNKQKGGAAT